jgi:hypothetical protein
MNNKSFTRRHGRMAFNRPAKSDSASSARSDTWMIAPRLFFGMALAALCGSCASTSIQSTWKSPDFKGGPVQKVSVLAVSGREIVRTALEHRFAKQLEKDGQPAITTVQILSLPEIKENKEAAAARLRGVGADSILITRLVGQSSHLGQARQTPTEYFAGIAVASSGGWHTYYSAVYSNSGVPRSDDRDYYLLETSLFELASGNRLWSCVTETEVKETADRFEIADALVAKVVEQMRKDGMVR